MSSFPQGIQGLNKWGLATSWGRSNEEKLHTEKSVKRTNPSIENTKPSTVGRKETIEVYAQDNLLLPCSKKPSFPHQWGPLCHRGNIPEGSRAKSFPLHWVMASQGNAESKLIPATCRPVAWQLMILRACHSWLSRNKVPLSPQETRSAYSPWWLLQLCLTLYSHKKICKRTNMNLSSDMEPLPNCSPHCCSQTWLCHCTREVTIVTERWPRLQGSVHCLLLALPLSFRGQGWVSTHQFIFYNRFIITNGRQNSDFTLSRDLEQNVILRNLSLYPYLNPSHRLANELNRRKGLLVLFNYICNETRHGICLLENAVSSTLKEMKSAMVNFLKVLTNHK